MNENKSYYCRFCAQSKPLRDLTNLEYNGEHFCKIKIKLLKINVEIDFEDAVLPKTVCSTCLIALDSIFQFVTTLNIAQETLKGMLLNNTDKVEVKRDINNEIVAELKDYVPYEIENPLDLQEDNQNIEQTKLEPDSINDEEIESTDFKIDINDDFMIHSTLDKTNDSDISASSEDKTELYKFSMQLPSNLDNEHCIKSVKTSDDSDELSDHSIESLKDTHSQDSFQNKPTWETYNWRCAICNSDFENSTELIQHSIQAHNCCNAFSCLDCHRNHRQLNLFLQHVQQKHRKHLKQSCYICYKQFTTLFNTNQHRITEHETTKYVCEGCNTSFTNIEELSKHRSTLLRTSTKILMPKELAGISDGLKCTVCDKTWKSEQSLRKHLWTHMKSRNRSILCDICGRQYYSLSALGSHRSVFHKPKIYKCEICYSKFQTHTRLRDHIAIHNTVKSFICEHCSKSFVKEVYLRRHLKIHAASSFNCQECDKSFKNKAYLTRHMHQHTGIKPYSCEICKHDFTNWPNYSKHMKRKHNMDITKKKRVDIKKKLEDKDLLEWKKKASLPIGKQKVQ